MSSFLLLVGVGIGIDDDDDDNRCFLEDLVEIDDDDCCFLEDLVDMDGALLKKFQIRFLQTLIPF
jgi:hypothetical protein